MSNDSSESPRPLSSLRPGDVIAQRYEIVDFLGRGAMGVVLKVIDRKLSGQTIALKILNQQLLSANPKSMERFISEVRIARSLSHPNIVRIHDIGEEENEFAYITMEYVKGHCLNDLIKESQGKGVDIRQAVSVLGEICAGISYAHKKGVIHRDIKPANILISEEGEIKIADFGLARAAEFESNITRTGEAVGTPAYMAPEQFRAEGVDSRVDIYSLGIIAYELACGILPFQSQTYFNLALQHMSEPLPDLKDNAPNVPEWYEKAVKKATAKKKEKRYNNAEELIEALATHLPELSRYSEQFGSPNILGPRTTQMVPADIARRNRTLVGLSVGGIFFSLLTLGVVTFDKAPVPVPPPKEVPIEVKKPQETPKTIDYRKPLERELLSWVFQVEKEQLQALRNAKRPTPKPNTITPRPSKEQTPKITAPSQLFQGNISISSANGEVRNRTLTLDIQIGKSHIVGSAEIDGYGKFKVSGRVRKRGLELNLDNRGLKIALAGTRRTNLLRGTFRIPSQSKSGKWQADLLD